MIVETDFPDHWKTRMLVDLLGNDEAAPVYLLRLWAHCQNRKSDCLENLPPAALKAICRYAGDAEQFQQALEACRWIEWDDGDLIVRGWADANAGLLRSIDNGKKGGRPKKETQEKPSNNLAITQTKPSDNLAKTDEIRGDKIREDKIRLDRAGSLKELSDFCLSLDLITEDAEYLWDHWEANEWKIKNKAIRDWKATVRNWKRQGYLPSQKNPDLRASSTSNKAPPYAHREMDINGSVMVGSQKDGWTIRWGQLINFMHGSEWPAGEPDEETKERYRKMTGREPNMNPFPGIK